MSSEMKYNLARLFVKNLFNWLRGINFCATIQADGSKKCSLCQVTASNDMLAQHSPTENHGLCVGGDE